MSEEVTHLCYVWKNTVGRVSNIRSKYLVVYQLLFETLSSGSNTNSYRISYTVSTTISESSVAEQRIMILTMKQKVCIVIFISLYWSVKWKGYKIFIPIKFFLIFFTFYLLSEISNESGIENVDSGVKIDQTIGMKTQSMRNFCIYVLKCEWQMLLKIHTDKVFLSSY